MASEQLGFTSLESSYPAYVNVLRFRNSGDIQVTVRGPSPDGGLTCGPSAVMALARADFVKFMTDVLRDVAYGPEVKTTP